MFKFLFNNRSTQKPTQTILCSSPRHLRPFPSQILLNIKQIIVIRVLLQPLPHNGQWQLIVISDWIQISTSIHYQLDDLKVAKYLTGDMQRCRTICLVHLVHRVLVSCRAQIADDLTIDILFDFVFFFVGIHTGLQHPVEVAKEAVVAKFNVKFFNDVLNYE